MSNTRLTYLSVKCDEAFPSKIPLSFSTPNHSFFQNSINTNITEELSTVSGINISCESSGILNTLDDSTSKTRHYTGGFTCCVPQCYNSKRDNELSFYVFPKESELRKMRLSKISRKRFSATLHTEYAQLIFQEVRKLT